MCLLAPATRLNNKTDDEMVVTMVNALGRAEGKKVIVPAKGFADLGYRKGIGRMGGKVTFLVEPASRSGVPGKVIFPIKVFEHAGIDIVYKLADESLSVSGHYENGASIDFKFENDTLFRRIWLVRWFYDSLASLGKCCFASGPEEAGDSAPPQAIPAAATTQPLAPIAAHVQATPSQDCTQPQAILAAPDQAGDPAPTPQSEIQLVTSI